MPSILGIIPARYSSTRFPAKPLAIIDGKSMIRRVYEQAKRSTRLAHVVVATDNPLIYDHVVSFGGEVCMTSINHPSGTDRCYEAAMLQKVAFDYVINVQGDEPFIAPQQIDLLASLLDGKVELGTLIKQIESKDQLTNPNLVRVIINKHSEAIYFTRSIIPFVRNFPQEDWLKHHTFYKHVGMYAYRMDVLKQITQIEPSGLELAESLEQLRWIENGFKIKVGVTELETIGIDTPEDLERAVRFLRAN